MANAEEKMNPASKRRAKGKERAQKIIQAAQKLLIDEGYHSLTLRRIANELSISNGNLTYYFPTKELLIKAVVTDNLLRYDEVYQNQAENFPDDPQQQLKSFFHFLLTDSQLKESQQFFYQIWAMSAHNQDVAELREQVYHLYLDRVINFLEPALPDKSKDELMQKAFLLMSINEGLNVMFGNGRTFNGLFNDLNEYLTKQIDAILFM